ncbi:MAG: hypothetical protein ACRY3E_00730 [Candidatus Lariskella arthropodorum]
MLKSPNIYALIIVKNIASIKENMNDLPFVLNFKKPAINGITIRGTQALLMNHSISINSFL